MIQNELYALLFNDAPVTAIATAIYPISGPQNAVFPVVVYARINDFHGQNFDEVENFVRSTFMVDSYAKNYTECLSLATAVRGVLNGYIGGSIQLMKLESTNDILERETDLYRISQNYEVWHTE